MAKKTANPATPAKSAKSAKPRMLKLPKTLRLCVDAEVAVEDFFRIFDGSLLAAPTSAMNALCVRVIEQMLANFDYLDDGNAEMLARKFAEAAGGTFVKNSEAGGRIR